MPRFLVLLLLLAPTIAAADPSADAAHWIDVLVHNKKLDPANVALVFDGSGVFKTGTPCAKLRVVAKASAADLATLASCMQTATKQLGLDGQALPDAKGVATVGARYLRSWFAPSLASSIVIPPNHRALGASINRETGNEGAGVGIMIYVVYDGAGKATAIYAYAGRWAYPI